MTDSSQYLSPLVSCVICKKVYSRSGIFSHYIAKHTEEGKERYQQLTSSGGKARGIIRTQEKLKRIKFDEEQSDLMCIFCNNPLLNKQRHNKFCSTSCSAKYLNNIRIDKLSTQKETKIIQYSESPSYCKHCSCCLPYDKRNATFCSNWCRSKGTVHKSHKERPKKYRTCVTCGRIDSTTGHFQSDHCVFCNPGLTYRRQCEFTFNIRDYPQEFDFDLLTKHGMFNPKLNPKGVSKDHIVSVQYGKDNKIDPSIVSHPANCRLILQGDNTRKQGRSDMTIEQLLQRIAEWECKYNR